MAFNSEDSKGAELKGAFFEFHEAEQSTKHVLYQLFAKDVNACSKLPLAGSLTSFCIITYFVYNVISSCGNTLQRRIARHVGFASI